jgi:DNA-directed RNA polymerase subunit RPC12/RpoP
MYDDEVGQPADRVIIRRPRPSIDPSAVLLVTRAQGAAMLNTSVDTMMQLDREGLLPAVRLRKGGQVYYRRADLVALVERGGVQYGADRKDQEQQLQQQHQVAAPMLKCVECDQSFERPPRGRPPMRCPQCRLRLLTDPKPEIVRER